MRADNILRVASLVCFAMSWLYPVTGNAYVGVNYSLDCKQYEENIHGGKGTVNKTDEEALRNSPFHIYELDRLTDKCKDDTSIGKALKEFFEYAAVQPQSNGPLGTDLMPNATTAAIEAQKRPYQIELEKMLAEFKKGDSTELMMVLRYMVWQTDDNLYANTACEIVARDFPEHYDELKPLTRDGSLERQAWEFNKWEWLEDEGTKKH